MRIPYLVARQIADHAEADAPREACGLLAGRGGEIARAIPLSNIAAEPSQRYSLDPIEELRALKAIDAAGLDWIGVYHSHPRSAPIPSQADMKDARDARLLHLIVSLERRQPRLKLWRLDGFSAEPVELAFVDDKQEAEDDRLSRRQQIAIVLAGLASLLLLVIVSVSLLPPAPQLAPVP